MSERSARTQTEGMVDADLNLPRISTMETEEDCGVPLTRKRTAPVRSLGANLIRDSNFPIAFFTHADFDPELTILGANRHANEEYIREEMEIPREREGGRERERQREREWKKEKSLARMQRM